MYCCCSVTQLCPTLCDPMDCSTRLPWPSPTPGPCSNSCPSSAICHPTISSSVEPFSSCPQSFPASGSFSMNQLFSSVQFSHSVMSSSLWPHVLQPTRLPCPSPTPGACSNSCPLNWWCHPTISSSVAPFSASVFPSIRVFSNESAVQIRWPKCWSFNFSISPSSEYSGLVSFKMDWFDLLAVQETVKSLLQHLSSKALILQHSAFFVVQLSHQYMTTEQPLWLYRPLSAKMQYTEYISAVLKLSFPK